MSCGVFDPRSRPGWTPVSGDCETGCPAAWRRGRGDAPGCPSRRWRRPALGPRLPAPAPPTGLVLLGQERRPGLRGAGLLSPRYAPVPNAGRGALLRGRGNQRLNPRAIGLVAGEGSIPRGPLQRQAGAMGATPGGTTGGVAGVGAVRPKVRLCCGVLTRPQRSKRGANAAVHTRRAATSIRDPSGLGGVLPSLQTSPPSSKRTSVQGQKS